jgi:serine/threonine-protein kinase RsbW
MFFSSDEIHLDLPASSKYLNVLSACIAEMLCRVEDMQDAQQITYNVQLAVHEGCTNIIDHAYERQGGRIGVRLELGWDPTRLIVELQDTGHSFDLSGTRHPDLSTPQVRGYGLHLMQHIMDEVVYQPSSGHNAWRLVKYL